LLALPRNDRRKNIEIHFIRIKIGQLWSVEFDHITAYKDYEYTKNVQDQRIKSQSYSAMHHQETP